MRALLLLPLLTTPAWAWREPWKCGEALVHRAQLARLEGRLKIEVPFQCGGGVKLPDPYTAKADDHGLAILWKGNKDLGVVILARQDNAPPTPTVVGPPTKPIVNMTVLDKRPKVVCKHQRQKTTMRDWWEGDVHYTETLKGD